MSLLSSATLSGSFVCRHKSSDDRSRDLRTELSVDFFDDGLALFNRCVNQQFVAADSPKVIYCKQLQCMWTIDAAAVHG
jgi:hypothetical protein